MAFANFTPSENMFASTGARKPVQLVNKVSKGKTAAVSGIHFNPPPDPRDVHMQQHLISLNR